MKNAPKSWTKILVDFLDFFEAEFEGKLEEFFEASGRAPSGRAGPGPPPVCRAEILKKLRGKSVPENYIYFFWGGEKFFGHFTY